MARSFPLPGNNLSGPSARTTCHSAWCARPNHRLPNLTFHYWQRLFTNCEYGHVLHLGPIPFTQGSPLNVSQVDMYHFDTWPLLSLRYHIQVELFILLCFKIIHHLYARLIINENIIPYVIDIICYCMFFMCWHIHCLFVVRNTFHERDI